MNQNCTPTSQAHCLTANEHYRATIIAVCRDCFTKAQTREEFATMMNTIACITNALSDYPRTDETFIRGVNLALHAVGRWTE